MPSPDVSPKVQELIDRAERTGSASLDLSNTNLTTLPENITKLTHLTMLSLWGNRITTVPVSIAQFSSLRSLDLRGNQLTTLPESIGKLTRLTTLNLSNNRLTTLPKSISNLPRLTTLDLSNNPLTTLPESITELTTLTMLYLAYNQFTTLPESISKLPRLTKLLLAYNQLTTLPESIGKLTRLTKLNLANNRLTTLPESISKLTHLTTLPLSNNRLTTLPESIMKLPNLTTLDLRGNRLTTLPESITELTSLTALYLSGNPLNMPPEIASTTNARVILNYLTRLGASRRPMNEAKVILVGEAKVGKTSLIKRLTGKPFDPNERKTDGIDIHHWDLEGVTCIETAGNADDTPRTIRLNVWDLGGQEIYHATHQFFLTQRTLYLLVLSARQTDEQNRLHYWLKTIRALGGEDAPILIVHNQHEENPEHLDRKTLREKYPSIAPDGFLETSCAADTIKGIDKLGDAIRRQIGKMRHVADPLPGTYFDVKERLEKETETHDFVSGAEYEALCGEAGVTDPLEASDILRLLHALGTVINFQDDMRLRDTNVLNPEWVTEGVYAVLDDPDLKAAADGQLHTNELSRVLQKAKKRFPTNKHAFIIDMMVRFELCFERSGKRGEYLVPELLAPIEPDDLGDFTNALQFEMQYDFLPRSVLPRFIVSTHYMLQTYRWRTGVVIEKDGSRARIRADDQDNKVRIAVAGNSATRSDLLSILRDHFDQIHRTPETLTVEEMVPLAQYPQAKPIPYRHLRQLEDRGRETFDWLDVSEPLNVAELLRGIENTRRREFDRSSDASDKETPAISFVRPPSMLPNLNDLLERTELLNVAPDNSTYLMALSEPTRKARIVPFVGAGMSKAFNMPGWEAALNAIYEDVKTSLTPDEIVRYATAKALKQWEKAAQALWDAENVGARFFNDRIKRLFGSLQLPSPITTAVSLLPRFAHGPVLTTNFDAALERVYTAAGQPFASDQTILGDYRANAVLNDWDDGKRFLLKLHGDADEAAGRVLTRDQYDHAYGKGSMLPELLRALFGSRKPLLFLGCSLQSDRTMTELKAAGLYDSTARHFAILESPATVAERQKRQVELIAQYGIQPIWFKPGDFAAIERVLAFLAEVYERKLTA